MIGDKITIVEIPDWQRLGADSTIEFKLKSPFQPIVRLKPTEPNPKPEPPPQASEEQQSQQPQE